MTRSVKIKKWVKWSGLLLVLLPFCAFVRQQPEGCLRQLDVNPLKLLSWSPQQQVCAYQNMDRLWPSNLVKHNPASKVELLHAGTESQKRKVSALLPKVQSFMHTNQVHGLLIAHKGNSVLEAYQEDFGPEKRWTSFSMAKSITGILAGIALKEGNIRSLDDPIVNYLPELKGSAYDGVTLKQILTMTSGVSWNENYRSSRSDVAKMTQYAAISEQAFLRYMASRPRQHKPGRHFNYSTGEAGLVGSVIRRATGKSLAQYLSEKVWVPAGMKQDAFWLTNYGGQEINGCCFSATLQDYGRLGMLMLNEGQVEEKEVLSSTWVKALSSSTKASRAQNRPYGYQWWIRDNGAYQASGIFGQLIHVDPKRDLVIVMLGAWETPTGNAQYREQRAAFIRQVRTHIDQSSGR